MSDCQGSIIPRYYGSYPLGIPVEERKRYVQLILIEWIPGIFMKDISPKEVPQPVLQTLMMSLTEFDILVYSRNINLGGSGDEVVGVS